MKRWPVFMFGCLIGFFLANGAQATSYDFYTIDAPGAKYTTVYDINNNGQMTGTYGSGQGATTGFVYSSGSFSDVYFPGSVYTVSNSINDRGDIAGSYNTSGHYLDYSGRGFILKNGAYTSFQAESFYPGDSNTTFLTGINNSGGLAGYYDNGAEFYGFKYEDGSYTRVNAFEINTGDINNSGVVASASKDEPPYLSGFVSDGTAEFYLSYPGGWVTETYGINDLGQVVGFYGDLDTGSPWGEVSEYHGFMYDDGQYSAFDFPGSDSTFAYGINNEGYIVGSYVSDGNKHGFVAVPVPEPATLGMLAIGISGLLMLRKKAG